MVTWLTTNKSELIQWCTAPNFAYIARNRFISISGTAAAHPDGDSHRAAAWIHAAEPVPVPSSGPDAEAAQWRLTVLVPAADGRPRVLRHRVRITHASRSGPSEDMVREAVAGMIAAAAALPAEQRKTLPPMHSESRMQAIVDASTAALQMYQWAIDQKACMLVCKPAGSSVYSRPALGLLPSTALELPNSGIRVVPWGWSQQTVHVIFTSWTAVPQRCNTCAQAGSGMVHPVRAPSRALPFDEAAIHLARETDASGSRAEVHLGTGVSQHTPQACACAASVPGIPEGIGVGACCRTEKVAGVSSVLLRTTSRGELGPYTLVSSPKDAGSPVIAAWTWLRQLLAGHQAAQAGSRRARDGTPISRNANPPYVECDPLLQPSALGILPAGAKQELSLTHFAAAVCSVAPLNALADATPEGQLHAAAKAGRSHPGSLRFNSGLRWQAFRSTQNDILPSSELGTQLDDFFAELHGAQQGVPYNIAVGEVVYPVLPGSEVAVLVDVDALACSGTVPSDFAAVLAGRWCAATDLAAIVQPGTRPLRCGALTIPAPVPLPKPSAVLSAMLRQAEVLPRLWTHVHAPPKIRLFHGTSICAALAMLSGSLDKRAACMQKPDCKLGACSCQMEGMAFYFAEPLKAKKYADRHTNMVSDLPPELVQPGVPAGQLMLNALQAAAASRPGVVVALPRGGWPEEVLASAKWSCVLCARVDLGRCKHAANKPDPAGVMFAARAAGEEVAPAAPEPWKASAFADHTGVWNSVQGYDSVYLPNNAGRATAVAEWGVADPARIEVTAVLPVPLSIEPTVHDLLCDAFRSILQ